MAKELMEIGGFITSGAEIVNHDTSLSGNGTIYSPLGIVHGYNETVLWSGSYTPVNNGTITLNSPASSFEKLAIGIYGHESFMPQYYEYELPPTTSIKTLPIVAYGIPGTPGIRFNTCKADFNDDYTVLTFSNCGQKSIENGTSITTASFNSKLYKVVGINRKA